MEVNTLEIWFLNECELILTSAAHDKARSVVENVRHPAWRDDSLERRVKDRLDQSYHQCINIMQSMKHSQLELQLELDSLRIVREERTPNESLKLTFRRLKQSWKIGFDRATYEQKIERLRRSKDDLCALRSQIDCFQSLRKDQEQLWTTWEKAPAEIADIQDVLRDAHSAWMCAFSCEDSQHLEHFVALSTKADTSSRGKLEMALAYSQDHEFDREQKQIKFLLQNHAIHAGLNTTANTPHGDRERRVRFADDPNDPKPSHPAVVPHAHAQTPDLSAIPNTCAYLERFYTEVETQQNLSDKLGHLTNETLCHYSFDVLAASIRSDQGQNHTPLDSILKLGRESVVPSTQLRIAINAALAVLQFHSTPWLKDSWRISDILLQKSCLFADTDPGLFLRSRLAYGADDTDPTPEHFGGVIIDRKGKSPASLPSATPEERYGIYNMTLFSLGVALLEIGQWKTLESLKEEQGANDVEVARRAASRRSVLGRKYQDVVTRCLRCDFGMGFDLSDADLQSAVYRMVVLRLKQLLEMLDGANPK
ncbi:hypothetical protein F4778DRAFT_786395 [Xylariomycetidae sp. FL2044]|nr:hypothetical protein F4778DRAFT_786395 [Xylariomycetidae sp. FL2044]